MVAVKYVGPTLGPRLRPPQRPPQPLRDCFGKRPLDSLKLKRHSIEDPPVFWTTTNLQRMVSPYERGRRGESEPLSS
jgi:hypothetical protein